MADTTETAETAETTRSSVLDLNSDRRPRRLLNAASLFTLVIGLFSFALGLFLRTSPSGIHAWAVVASVTGLAAMLVGLVCQMISETREERIILVTGIIAGFVGLALGLGLGGF
jgi:ammonia channel protein AmtB